MLPSGSLRIRQDGQGQHRTNFQESFNDGIRRPSLLRRRSLDGEIV
jgi:hypothetical protein